VRVVARHPERLEPLVDHGAEPFVGSADDRDAMTTALAGATAAYVMIPPNPQAPDIDAYAARVTEAVATALERSTVTHIVMLSSLGAELPDRSGPVLGLHRMEGRLSRLPGRHVLALRAGYLMENHLASAPMIKQMGVNGGLFRPDVALPMIAAQDIAEVAADRLLRKAFSGSSYEDLSGPRDLSFREVTTIIGRHIGKTDLAYVQIPADQVRQALVGAGMSPDLARGLIEVWSGLDEGRVRPTRTPTTAPQPTSFEEDFAREHAAAFR
jgi:uncharacterized protein YbjT (DUF2867 family)